MTSYAGASAPAVFSFIYPTSDKVTPKPKTNIAFFVHALLDFSRFGPQLPSRWNTQLDHQLPRQT
ncbi:hypothetical protein ACQCRI_02555 [Ralstonia pseudosolanacearum]|uniref:hypothetical protein n=1 Tax=Ralstonia pseudosolanacearum TaxID=1310165 RepID=UPI00035B24DE|nr:hypothetical protein [Ralstonia pseudosolanacearum]ESS48895.1 hypothetical protein L665_04089 [Ralstonia solanacearum SD54]MCK4147578.1 hypothetical protein [Ralstonia pseudosolanacearum]